MSINYYLRQRGHVMVRRLYICPSTCLLASLRKILNGSYENFTTDVSVDKKELTNFGNHPHPHPDP